VSPFVLYLVAGSACGDLPSIALVVSLPSEDNLDSCREDSFSTVRLLSCIRGKTVCGNGDGVTSFVLFGTGIDALAKSFSGDQGSISAVEPTGGGEAWLLSEDWPWSSAIPGTRGSATPAPKQVSAPTTIKTDCDAHRAGTEVGAPARGRTYLTVESGPEFDAEWLIGGRFNDEAGGSKNPSRKLRGSIRYAGSSRRTGSLFEDVLWFEDILASQIATRASAVSADQRDCSHSFFTLALIAMDSAAASGTESQPGRGAQVGERRHDAVPPVVTRRCSHSNA
jgi:hypothetical protein